jgi:DNA-binding NtrC family response regulator
MDNRILVVDDEESIRTVLRTLLSRLGYEVSVACDGVEALDYLSSNVVDVVLTDLRMPNMGGLKLLESLQQSQPDIPVVVLTAHGSVDTAVEAIKLGAFDFLSKGCDNDDVANVVAKALATRALHSSKPVAMVGHTGGRFGLIGSSPSMSRIFDVIERVAASPSTILLTGESGTGKELVARALHQESDRSDGAFIRVNCAAIPTPLIESELFGYERGAFTGAVSSKPGRFELADNGTLFLDEIGEISSEMQVKLLRAIQENEFERVGGVKTIRVNVRLITATNRDLAKQVELGHFREDLYYRLNVVPLHLPPLRDRMDDFEDILNHLLNRFAIRLNQSPRRCTSEAVTQLKRHGWPGNIRELENIVERTLLFSDQPEIGIEDLALTATAIVMNSEAPAASIDADDDLKTRVRKITRRVEHDMIEKALEETSGNVTQAAKKLGISRKSLQMKMKELGLREALS